jgi:hypothetical protein
VRLARHQPAEWPPGVCLSHWPSARGNPPAQVRGSATACGATWQVDGRALVAARPGRLGGRHRGAGAATSETRAPARLQSIGFAGARVWCQHRPPCCDRCPRSRTRHPAPGGTARAGASSERARRICLHSEQFDGQARIISRRRMHDRQHPDRCLPGAVCGRCVLCMGVLPGSRQDTEPDRLKRTVRLG